MQRTKLITTIGPATDSKEQLEALLLNGAGIARLNFSHGTDAWFLDTLQKIQEVQKTHKRALGTLVDTKGPEIRTQNLDQARIIEAGEEYTIGYVQDTKADIPVDYPHLTRDVAVGQRILIDGGTLTMHVTGHKDTMLLARAEQSGSITSRRHVNVPGVHLDLPILDSNDERLLRLTIEAGADMVALSFVNRPEDLATVRTFLSTITDRYIPLITKIETQNALDAIDAIVEASDGIMIARGDLGIEIPMELLPSAQRLIMQVCQRHRKPCIVATHMMKSMTEHPTPTRAEILDVGHAVYDGTDAIMTSEETSVGAYAQETVQLMTRIARATEESLLKSPAWALTIPGEHTAPEELLQRVQEINPQAIVYHPKSLEDIQKMAAYRLPLPCLFASTDPLLRQYASLCYGQFSTEKDTDALAAELFQEPTPALLHW